MGKVLDRVAAVVEHVGPIGVVASVQVEERGLRRFSTFAVLDCAMRLAEKLFVVLYAVRWDLCQWSTWASPRGPRRKGQ